MSETVCDLSVLLAKQMRDPEFAAAYAERRAASAAQLGVCPSVGPITGEFCIEPRGHDGGHMGPTDEHGNASGWPTRC